MTEFYPTQGQRKGACTIPHFCPIAPTSTFVLGAFFVLGCCLCFKSTAQAEELHPHPSKTPLITLTIKNPQATWSKFLSTPLGILYNNPEYKTGRSSIQKHFRSYLQSLGYTKRSLPILPNTPLVISLMPLFENESNKLSSFSIQVFSNEKEKLKPFGLLFQNQVQSFIRSFSADKTEQLKTSIHFLPFSSDNSIPDYDIQLHFNPFSISSQIEKKNDGAFESVSQVIQSINSITWGFLIQNKTIQEEFTINLSQNPLAKPVPSKNSIGLQIFSRGLEVSSENDKKSRKEMIHIAESLPFSGDVCLLVRSNWKTTGALFVPICRALERHIRGKKWTRKYGSTHESMNSNRYKILPETFSGVFGGTGEISLSGKPNLAFFFHKNGTKVNTEKLLTEISAVGAEFIPSKSFPSDETTSDLKIFSPTFKGRGQFPAPLIGISSQSASLYSTPTAYRDTKTIRQNNQSFLKDRQTDNWFGPYLKALKEDPNNNSKAPSMLVHIRLARILPLAYAKWLLSPGGPHIGAYRVPPEMLPKMTVINKQIVDLKWAVTVDSKTVKIKTSGMLPGAGAALPALLTVLGQEKIQPAMNLPGKRLSAREGQ